MPEPILQPSPPAPAPAVSICVLAGHGATSLEACLASLRAQVGAPSFELLIGGQPTPASLAVIDRHFPDAQICHTGTRLPGAARNPLIDRARGELLLFLDDDVTAPPEFLARLEQLAARHPEASVFGGPNVTPPDSSRFELVQGAVLSSLVGAGPVSRRYGARRAGFADERWFTLCNLAVRRKVMLPFVSHLVCAEENALLTELRSRGERMLYEPSLRIFHVRRPRLRPFVRQMFKYGRGRGQLLGRHPSFFRTAYAAPSALLVYVVLLPALIALLGHAGLLLAPVALYGILTVATATRIAWSLRTRSEVPLALLLILTVHVCYGAGVLRGLFGRHPQDQAGGVEWSPGRAEPSEAPRLASRS